MNVFASLTKFLPKQINDLKVLGQKYFFTSFEIRVLSVYSTSFQCVDFNCTFAVTENDLFFMFTKFYQVFLLIQNANTVYHARTSADTS